MSEYIIENLFGVSGWVIGLLSLIWGVVTYYKQKKAKKLSYMVRDFNLLNDTLKKVKKLEVSFAGSKVENLTVSKIAIWNDGTETIDGKDIPLNSKLRIVAAKDTTILDFDVLVINNKSNGFKLTPDQSGRFIYLDFEYIDPNESIIIQVYHTGTGKFTIFLNGAVKGVKNIEQKFEYGTERSFINYIFPPTLQTALSYIAFGCILPVVVTFFLLRNMWVTLFSDVELFSYDYWMSVTFVSFFILINFINTFLIIKGLTRRLPNGFKLLFQDN